MVAMVSVQLTALILSRSINYIEGLILVPHGAPFANKNNHFSGRGLMTCDAGWQSGLVADDQDPVFVDADFGNLGPEIGLPGLNACCLDLLAWM